MTDTTQPQHGDFSGVRNVLLDLGDTLIHGNFTAGATRRGWERISPRLVSSEAGEDTDYLVPPLERIREAIAEHVGQVMAVAWRDKTGEEMDILALFKAAFEAG